MLKPRSFAVLVVLGAVLCLAGPSLLAQGSAGWNTSGAVAPAAGLPYDWSHHRSVFSPATTAQTQQKLSREPRYSQQFYWRNGAAMATIGVGLPTPVWPGGGFGNSLKSDWSMDMGSGATVGADMFPAKYSFSPIGAPSCGNDFVVYNTGLAGTAGTDAAQTGTVSGTPTTASGQTITIANPANSSSITLTATPTVASATGAFSGEPAANGTITITSGSNSIRLTAVSTGATNACTATGSPRTGSFTRSGTTSTDASSLSTLINSSNCGSYVGVTSSAAGDVVTVSATATGTGGNSIAIAESMTNFSWSGSALSGGLAASNSGTYFETSSTAATEAGYIATAITNNGGTVGVSATSNGGTVTVTATGEGTAGNSITLTEAVSNFSWAGGTLAGGAAGQATIVAYNNLYAGTCSSVPSVYWQYNTAYPQGSTTGDGSAITTSVALSADGTEVAFVENNSSSVASLVLLKWKSGSSQVEMDSATNNVTAAAYPTCTAPCMTRLTFTNSHKDTHSSPFYDYADDVLYVGDDPTSTTSCTTVNANCANLHKFTGVFKGTPEEVTGNAPWPVYLAAAPLSSPIYDSTSGYIFAVSSYDGTSNGGRLHQVLASSGVNSASGQLTGTTATASACNVGTSGSGTALVMESPLIDSSAGRVYVFTGNDGDGHAGVFQFAPGFTAQSCGTEETVGTGSTSGVPLYAGAFDNIYLTSATPTGNIYVCGQTGGTPTLYEVPISNNVLGASTAGPAVANGSTTCSPVTEFYNSTDRIFLSVQADNKTASPISCPTGTGCIMSFGVSGTKITTSTATSATALETDGTSGIVIDNASASAGASQVYFSTLGNQTCTTSTGTGGCAIQASQSGLD